MDRFNFWFKTYLGFSQKESRGFLLLVPLLVVFGLIPTVLEGFKNRNADKLYQKYMLALDSLEQSQIELVSSPLPVFNPADTVKSSTSKATQNLNRLLFSEADSITLQIVPGIGPALAGRIIKFREALGGFHSTNQLGEIYGVKQETADKIWEYFEFDGKVQRKIHINQATIEDLSGHPYISYSEAKVLLAYKTQHGSFQSLSDLSKIKIFKQEWIDKIGPYLDFK